MYVLNVYVYIKYIYTVYTGYTHYQKKNVYCIDTKHIESLKSISSS